MGLNPGVKVARLFRILRAIKTTPQLGSRNMDGYAAKLV